MFEYNPIRFDAGYRRDSLPFTVLKSSASAIDVTQMVKSVRVFTAFIGLQFLYLSVV
jgi:hypothetical protein